MLQTGDSLLRRRLSAATKDEFAWLSDLYVEGVTDYVAIISRFAADSVIGEMDGVYSSWATKAPGGFSDDQIATLKRLVPYLALAIKSVALARMTGTLMETYLGRDAGQRVLGGRISARRCRQNRRCRLVQRFARLHAHYRHCTGTGNPIIERLLGRHRLGDTRAWR